MCLDGISTGIEVDYLVRGAALRFSCLRPFWQFSLLSGLSRTVGAGVGAVRSSWAVSSSLAEAIVSMGDTSSEGSAAFVSEPTCSSSVLPIMIGEVGDSVA